MLLSLVPGQSVFDQSVDLYRSLQIIIIITLKLIRSGLMVVLPDETDDEVMLNALGCRLTY